MSLYEEIESEEERVRIGKTLDIMNKHKAEDVQNSRNRCMRKSKHISQSQMNREGKPNLNKNGRKLALDEASVEEVIEKLRDHSFLAAKPTKETLQEELKYLERR